MHSVLYLLLAFTLFVLCHPTSADKQFSLPDKLTITGDSWILPNRLPVVYTFSLDSQKYPANVSFTYQIHHYIGDMNKTKCIHNETITSNSSVVEYQFSDIGSQMNNNITFELNVQVFMHKKDVDGKMIAQAAKYICISDNLNNFLYIYVSPIHSKLIVHPFNGQQFEFSVKPHQQHYTALTLPSTELTYSWIITGPNRKTASSTTTRITSNLPSFTANFTRIGNYSAVVQITANISGIIKEEQFVTYFIVERFPRTTLIILLKQMISLILIRIVDLFNRQSIILFLKWCIAALFTVIYQFTIGMFTKLSSTN